MKKLLLIFFALSSFLSISAQSSDKFTGSLLWKVSGKNLNEPSYILGTHHLAPLSVLDNIPSLKKAQNDTRQVAGELVLNDKAGLQNMVMQRAQLPAGESYKAMLSEADYKQLDEGLKSILGVGLDQVGTMHPAMLSMSVTIMLYMKVYPDLNLMTHIPIDEQMQTDANNSDKTVIALETTEDQIAALFDAEPIPMLASSLACSMGSLGYAVESMKTMDACYNKGDLAGMYDLSFNNPDDPCPSSEESQYALCRDRNNKWLKKIPEIMSDKPTLFVVGALHLAGEEGLLFQLDKMGYKIEIVK